MSEQDFSIFTKLNYDAPNVTIRDTFEGSLQEYQQVKQTLSQSETLDLASTISSFGTAPNVVFLKTTGDVNVLMHDTSASPFAGEDSDLNMLVNQTLIMTKTSVDILKVTNPNTSSVVVDVFLAYVTPV